MNENKQKKVLPLDTDVLVKTYAYFGDYLSILKGNGYDYEKILFDCFLKMDYIPLTGQVNFQNKKKLKSLMEVENINCNKNQIINYVMDSINNDYYVHIFMDDNKFSDNTYNLGVHNWMVYGYDQEKDKIYLLGFIFEAHFLTYKKIELNYETFENAVVLELNSAQKRRISNNQISKIPDNFIYNSKNSKLKKYLNIVNFFLIHLNVFSFLTFHNFMFSFLGFNPYKRRFLDLRDIRIVYEQILVFSKFINKYSFNDEHKEQLDTIKKLGENTLNIAAKYHFKENKSEKRKFSKSVNKNLYKIKYYENLLFKSVLSDYLKN